MIFALFKGFPPSVSVPLFYFYIVFGYILRFFFMSPPGLLLVSMILYCNAKTYIGSVPLTLEQLFYVISGLDKEYKVALLTSFVTIVGFAIAFHTATINWRNQMRSQLMLNVSAEIEGFFAGVSNAMTTLEIHAESLIDSVNKIQGGMSMRDAAFEVDFNQDQQQKYLHARSFISEAASEVHRLIGRNHNALASNWGALPALHRAAKALSDVSSKMWIHLPIIKAGEPNRVQIFINQVNVDQCRELVRACEASNGIISGLTGGVRGQLQASVIGINLSSLAGLVVKRKDFRKAIEEFHKLLNEKG